MSPQWRATEAREGRPSGTGRPRFVPALALFAALAGCIGGSGAEEERVLVLAASSLQFALPEVVSLFEERTGLTVDVALGSSGNLVAQIENGAPADLFLSADRAFVDRLEAGGRAAPGTSRDYATGRVALVAPPGRPAPDGLTDLADPSFEVIALANPETAPYGLAARQALESAGLWGPIQPRIVLSENIAQAAQFVRTGNADAGILALSVVLEVGGWEHRIVDPALHDPIVQAGTVVAGSANAVAAEALLGLIVSREGSGILSRYGFAPPLAEPASGEPALGEPPGEP